MERAETEKDDPDVVQHALDNVAQSIVDTYKKSLARAVASGNKRKKPLFSDDRRSVFPDSTIISIRSAIRARENMSTPRRIPLQAIADLHGVSLGHVWKLSRDWSLRSGCVPDDALVQKFMEQFQAARAEIDTIKAMRPAYKDRHRTKKDTRINKKSWTIKRFMRECKRVFGHYPEDGVDAFLMCRELLKGRVIDVYVARQCVDLIWSELCLFKELEKEPSDAAEAT